MRLSFELRKLGDACEVESSSVSQNQLANEDGDYEIYGASGLIKKVSFYHQDKPYISIVKDGSGFGRVTKMDAYTSVIGTLQYIIPKESIDLSYLYYSLLAIDFKKYVAGAAIPHIYFKDYKNEPFLWVPNSEQKRIVAILDEAFENLETAKANAEQSLKNARELFESYLQEVFTRRGEGWIEKRLGDVVTRLTNGYVGPTRNIYQESGVPYLLARHVKNNQLLFDGKTFISEEFNRKNKKSILKTGDVLLVQSGHIGHSAVVTEDHAGHNCHAMIVITAVYGAFTGPYLSLFFNSPGMKQKFQEIRSGSTVPHLTCGEVKELMVPLPDLSTQNRIVEHSREISNEIQRLESICRQKITALDELKKALLHKAFSGEL